MNKFTSILLILVSVGIFYFFIDPQYNEINELKAEVATNEETLKIAEQLRKSREALRQQYNRIPTEDREKLEKLLPDTVDNVRLIIDINNIAEQFGIVIEDIQIDEGSNSESTEAGGDMAGDPMDMAGPEAGPTGFNSGSNFEGVLEDDGLQYADPSVLGIISFSFGVSAQYDVFLEFLMQLEESLRIVDIRDVEVNRGEEGGAFYDYKVTLDTYWLK